MSSNMSPEEKKIVELQYKLETMSEMEIYEYAVENFPNMSPIGKKKILIRRIVNTARNELIENKKT
ncbi:MAG: hypothetical protein GX362_01600 [Methanosarcinaceae archaeon]|nr:hypothetical protein [Methanosarcinaceae archaeon]